MAEENPDSEIRLENIIPGSPHFVLYKQEKTKGKGKHVKNIKVNIDSADMSKTKCTKTRAELVEEAKGKIKAKSKVLHAKHVADAVKKAVPKPQWTHATSNKPRWQTATKTP